MPKLAKRAAAYAGVSDEVFGDGQDAKDQPSGQREAGDEAKAEEKEGAAENV